MDIAIYDKGVWLSNQQTTNGTVIWPDGSAALGTKFEDFPLTAKSNDDYVAYIRVFQVTRNSRFQTKSGTTTGLVDNKHTVTETVTDMAIEDAKEKARGLVLAKREEVLATPYSLKDEFDASILRFFETTENQLSRMDRLERHLAAEGTLSGDLIDYPESNGEVFSLSFGRFQSILTVISAQELMAYTRQKDIVALIDDEDIDTIAELDTLMDTELDTGWPR